NISDSEKLAMFNQEITNYNKQIAELDKEINLLAQSTDLDATTKKAKLEAEKALAEEKRKVTEAEKIRLAEIEKAKAEEQIKHTEREEEQQKRISEVSQEANKRAAELRNLKMANQSSLGVLRVIEAKKAALIEIRENVENEQAAIAQSIEKEYNTKIDALNNTLWRKSQTLADNKTPTEKAKRERAEEIEKLRIECINKIETEQNRIKNATKASQNEIYNEISTDLKTLGEKIFYANTLDRNLRMTIGEYDGNKESWEVKYSVLSDGVELYTGYSEIKYADLEKLKPSKMTYDDAVDMYDSLFKLNEPVLTFEISYKIEPVKDLISTYEYEFHRLEAFDTTSIKNTNSSALSGNSFLCSGSAKKVYKEILPGYDFRTEEEKQKIANAKRIEDEKRRKQEEKRQRKLEQKREIKDSLGNMVRLGIEGNFSSGYFILDYGTRWMLGGGGAVEINYVTTHKWGFGLIFDVSYLHSITEEAELNFLPISFHFLVEKHIPVKTGPLFVIRPRGTIGMGGSSYWKDDTPEGKELSYFLLITTLGCYFDFYNSNKFVAFYFGPSIRASLAVSDENPIPAIGLLQPSFSVGVKFNYMAK
ncbi:MAG: hypothetical protein J1G30_10180, partial [Spirochaetales bacterium]|nr:hypothetical protein [Spirochaetales bacterium]